MLSLQDAKNRFSAVVDAALQGRPQQVSRRGKPAVVVLSVTDYTRLVAAAGQGADRPSFADHLLAVPPDAAPFDRADATARDIEF